MDEEIPVSFADTAITVYDFAAWVCERRREGNRVSEAVAVARGSIGLAGFAWRGS